MIQKHTFSLLSYIRKDKANKDGSVPVYLRITLDGRRAELSAKTFVDPLDWNKSKGRLKGTHAEARRLNRTIESFEHRAREIYNRLIEKGKILDADDIKNELLGSVHKQRTLVLSFSEYVVEIEAQVNIDFSPGTIKNWKVTLGHLKEFAVKKYRRSDIAFKELDENFLLDFDNYARRNWGCGTNAVIKHIQRIRKIVKKAVSKNWLDKDPFITFEATAEKTHRTFLTLVELDSIENKTFEVDRLEKVKDIFIFSCYTGLAYIDVEKLTGDNLVTGIDGKKWIYTFREKTNEKSNIPLLPKALQEIANVCVTEKKKFMLLQSLYEILQIVSISIFEKMPINQLFQQAQQQYFEEQNHNQLRMFDKYQNASGIKYILCLIDAHLHYYNISCFKTRLYLNMGLLFQNLFQPLCF
jgi:hypothetical protein